MMKTRTNTRAGKWIAKLRTTQTGRRDGQFYQFPKGILLGDVARHLWKSPVNHPFWVTDSPNTVS